VLGALRVGLLVARVGTRTAELLELPLMVGVSFLAARWVTRRWRLEGRRPWIAVGALALLLLLAAEVALGVVLGGETPAEALLARDPVSGPAYYAALLCFAAFPAILGPRAPPPSP
jgi:hypothetical protein